MDGDRFDLFFAEGLVYDLGVEEAEGGPYEPGGVAVYFDLVLAVDPGVGFADYFFEGYYALEEFGLSWVRVWFKFGFDDGMCVVAGGLLECGG